MSEITLIQKIKDETTATVDSIKAAGMAQIEGIQRESKDAIATYVNEQKANLQKKLSHMELVSLAQAKQSGKIAIQSTKREQIDALFAEVTAEIIELSDDEYVKLFKSYVKETVPKSAKIKEVEAPAKRVDETASILKELDLEGKVKKNNQLTAGVIVHTEDGVYDVTLERILGDKRAELEMQLIKKLTE